MFRFDFTIQNPFHNETKSPWQSLYQGEWIVSKNKTLEIGFFRYTYELFGISLDTRWRGQDHAGLSLEINMFGWKACISLPDHRHWNSGKNRWNTDDEYGTKDDQE